MTVILNNAVRLVSLLRIGADHRASRPQDANNKEAMRRYRLKAEYSEIFEKELRHEFSNPGKSTGN